MADRGAFERQALDPREVLASRTGPDPTKFPQSFRNRQTTPREHIIDTLRGIGAPRATQEGAASLFDLTPAAGAFELGSGISRGDTTDTLLGAAGFLPLGAAIKGIRGAGGDAFSKMKTESERIISELAKRADPNRATRPVDAINQIRPGPKNPNSPFYKPNTSEEMINRLAIQGREQRLAKEAQKKKNLESKHQLDIDEDVSRREREGDGIPRAYGRSPDELEHGIPGDIHSLSRKEREALREFYDKPKIDAEGRPIRPDPFARSSRNIDTEKGNKLIDDLQAGRRTLESITDEEAKLIDMIYNDDIPF